MLSEQVFCTNVVSVDVLHTHSVFEAVCCPGTRWESQASMPMVRVSGVVDEKVKEPFQKAMAGECSELQAAVLQVGWMLQVISKNGKSMRGSGATIFGSFQRPGLFYRALKLHVF